jgi:hypothetical protein
MPRTRPRIVRVARVRLRRLLRRWDRETPEWMRWLTPWGTSLALHALALLLLAAIVYGSAIQADRGRAIEVALPSQLRDDLTALKPSDHAGDPFSHLVTNEPPSLSLDPSHTDPDVSNVPRLPPTFKLGEHLNLGPKVVPRDQGGDKKGGTAPADTRANQPSAPFTGRRGDMRAKLVLREGGSVESERAVDAGLDWIARHQRPDGGWSLQTVGQCVPPGCPERRAVISDTAATGLALLPFLGAGHTHVDKGPYQQTIRRGLRWLMKAQKSDGEIYLGGVFNAAFYSHAIASMALCEAYGITGDKGLRASAQKAINYIEKTQNTFDGGWRYSVGMAGDTSVFGWQLFALRSASLSGLKVSKMTVRRCRTFLDLVAADPQKVTYAYLPGNRVSSVMTAEALLGRQYLGWKRDHPALLQGAALIAADLEADQERNIYYWYYATQMLHNMHSKEWQQWNLRVRETLIATQVTGKGCDRGSWDPEDPPSDRHTIQGGRLYLTSLSLLTLEVYYRYLPLYRDADGAIDGEENSDFAAVAADQEPRPADAKAGSAPARPADTKAAAAKSKAAEQAKPAAKAARKGK